MIEDGSILDHQRFKGSSLKCSRPLLIMYEWYVKGLLLKSSEDVFLSLVSVSLMRTLLDLSGFILSDLALS